MDVKAAGDGFHGRQVFLILGRDRRFFHGPSTRRTRRRERHVADFINDDGLTAVALPPIGLARLAPRAPRPALRCALRERRRLPSLRAARRLQFFFQPGILSLEFSAFALRPFEIAPELLVLVAQCLDRLGGARRNLTTVGAHAPLMPESQRQYKC